MNKHTKTTYVIHGVANRDPNELVCMFFGSLGEAWQFATELPGRYDLLLIEGANLMDDDVTIAPYDTRHIRVPATRTKRAL